MDARRAEVLAHIAELERRDAIVETASNHLAQLADHVATIRRRAVDTDAALQAIPEAIRVTEGALDAATVERREATDRLKVAEGRLESLERSRRSKEADLDQARRELTRAREELSDADVRVRRHETHLLELADDERVYEARADGLRTEALETSREIAATERVADAGKIEPGIGLAALEEWGAQARSALFVARGGIDAERERLVLEANALGASVLGDQAGSASVALVRRQLETVLSPADR